MNISFPGFRPSIHAVAETTNKVLKSIRKIDKGIAILACCAIALLVGTVLSIYHRYKAQLEAEKTRIIERQKARAESEAQIERARQTINEFNKAAEEIRVDLEAVKADLAAKKASEEELRLKKIEASKQAKAFLKEMDAKPIVSFDGFPYSKNFPPALIKSQLFPMLDLQTWVSLAQVNRTFRKFSQSREAVKDLHLFYSVPLKQRVKFALQAGILQKKFHLGFELRFIEEEEENPYLYRNRSVKTINTLNTLFQTCTNIESIVMISISHRTAKALTSLKFPKSLTTLSFDYFRNCDSFDFLEKLPSTVDHLIFRGCDSFNNLKIPDHVSSIQFISCNSNHTIQLPSQLTTLKIVDSIFSDFALKNISNFQTFSVLRSKIGEIEDKNIKYFTIEGYSMDNYILNCSDECTYDNLESVTIQNSRLTLENWKYFPRTLKELRIISCIDSESRPILNIPQEVRNLHPTCQISLTSRESQKG